MRVNIQKEGCHTKKGPAFCLRYRFPILLNSTGQKMIWLVSIWYSRKVGPGGSGFHFQEKHAPSGTSPPRGSPCHLSHEQFTPNQSADPDQARFSSCSCTRGSPNRKGHQAQTAEAIQHTWHTPPLHVSRFHIHACLIDLFTLLSLIYLKITSPSVSFRAVWQAAALKL